MKTYRHICLIPAKGASKRLKNKNILKINGRELIFYPIQAAKKSLLFQENIFVSTELEKIGSIATKYGTQVHYRDEYLANDPYGVKDVAIDFLEKNNLSDAETLTILLPTAPLITHEDIIGAHRHYKQQKCKYLMSVVETDHNALRSVFLNKEKTEIIPIFPRYIEKRSQQLKPTYRVNGAIIIVDINDFLKTKKYFNYPLGTYIMPRERSIDIDEEFDYRLVKFIMEDC